MARRRLAVAAAWAGFALTAAPAAGQDPDVQVDPGSPSAREYALPLVDARDSTRGESTPQPKSGGAQPRQATAPLFGAGAEPDQPAGDAAGVSRKNGSAGQSGSPNDKQARRQVKRKTPPAVARAAAGPAVPGGDAGTSLLLLGTGAALVAVAAGAGLLYRRASRR